MRHVGCGLRQRGLVGGLEIDDGEHGLLLELSHHRVADACVGTVSDLEHDLRVGAAPRQILLAAGIAALVVAAAIVWLSIRRGLRPIDDTIDAAERIADGDTARTTTPQPASEVGHLSAALNTMLDRIEEAMATKAESEARMRRFVADASHELRTPLTSIRGYAELHRQGATSP